MPPCASSPTQRKRRSSLREYAKIDHLEVIRYVRHHKDRLSPLSKREAVRNLIKEGLLDAVP